MANNLYNTMYNPDVLSCIANLSNDEVFTPPEVANAMLDLLPQELFSDPNTTFLDPACKSGVFLREIAKRLLKGLEPLYPDLQERTDHIFKHQLYGIAITELTSHLSRRSLYCSKFANGKYSVVHFDSIDGNVRFKNVKHRWQNGRCVFCGAMEKMYDRGNELESYAYEFIHTTKLEALFNMKFDVIIGNPPYQMTFGIQGGNSANAKSIYNLFVEQAQKMRPRYLCMITPSRWMTKTAQGIPEAWVDEQLQSNKFSVIHDFEDASECFPGVEIKGGVSYFLWEKDYQGKCDYHFHPAGGKDVLKRYDYLDSKKAGIVIRSPEAYSVIQKITDIEGEYYQNQEDNFSGLVSAKHFFDNSDLLTSNWTGYQDRPSAKYCIKYYLNVSRERSYRWISADQLPKNHATKDLFKVFIPAAGGSGNDDVILGKPFIGEPNSVCSQTFLVIGYDPQKHNFSETECRNIIKYISTRFFRYLVSIKKKTQNGPRGVYQFVPLQDFSQEWTDERLFEKYSLSEEEIKMISELIRTVDFGESE